MFKDSWLLVMLVLFPELSQMSNPGREAGPVEPDFLLPREGAVGSVKEDLLGTGPLRS